MVLTKISRAAKIYRKEGIRTLFRKSLNRLIFVLRVCRCEYLTDIRRAIQSRYWNVRGHQTITLSGTEIRFDATTDAGGDIIRWRVELEKEQLVDLIENLRPDDIFLDVGACIGTYTLFAASKLTNGKVVAIEPYRPNANQLRKNAEYNRTDNIEVREIALTDSEGMIGFRPPETEKIGVGNSSITTNSNVSSTKVPTRKGDSMVSRGDLPQPNVVKIDVEGAEPLTLSGMSGILSNSNCRLLYCEIHLPADHRASIRDHGEDLEELKERIKQFGFDIERFERRGDEIHMRARKQE